MPTSYANFDVDGNDRPSMMGTCTREGNFQKADKGGDTNADGANRAPYHRFLVLTG